MKVLKKEWIFLLLLFSANAFAGPIKFKIPLIISSLPNGLFSSVKITDYMVDGERRSIPSTPTMTQGDEYETPLLDLGERTPEVPFQFYLQGLIRARNSDPAGDDVIVPFRMMFTARALTEEPSTVVNIDSLMLEVDNDSMHGGIPLAHRIHARERVPNRFILFNNNQALNRYLQLVFDTDGMRAFPALVLPDLLSN